MLALAVLVSLLQVPPGEADRPPNIVIFLVDDMGYTDSSTYGSRYYETPHLDRLAAGGMKFTQGYAASPVCSPTRASIMTGKTPARVLVSDWITGHGDAGKPLGEPPWTRHLRQDEVTIAEVLKARGYATAFVGKWHLGRTGRSEADPTTQGFDLNIGGGRPGSPNGSTGSHFADSRGSFGLPGLGPGSSRPGEYLTDRLTRAAKEIIVSQARAGGPFFLFLSHYAVHTPIQAKPELITRYRNKPPSGGHSNPTYAAMIDSMDQSLGVVLDTLEDPDGDGDRSDGIDAETVVFYLSDNGGLLRVNNRVTNNAPLRGGKGTNYEGGIRIPFVVRWPGHTPPGSESPEVVVSHDLYPTILDIALGVAGGDAVDREGLDGISLVPVLEQTGGRDGPIFFHYPHYHPEGATPHGAIRDGDWKLILDYLRGRTELYNLATDIGETRNLVSRQQERATSLRQRLLEYLASIDAQLPIGTPVRLPSSGRRGAGVISINLGTGPNTTMAPQEFAGLVHENHWNNAISPAQRSGSGVTDLVDGDGEPTGARFEYQAGYMFFNSNGGSGNYRMMDGWGGNNAGDTGNRFSLASLPGVFTSNGYDVYVYLDSNASGTRARRMSFTIGDVTLFARELESNFNGFLVEADSSGVTSFAGARPGNCVVFRDLHLPEFDLIVDAADGWRATVNGIQLVARTDLPPGSFVRGDPNEDGSVDLSDAILILISLFAGEKAPDCLESADVDDSGSVDLTDAIFLLDFLFLGGTRPPPPFPGCGLDPTAGATAPGCEDFPPCR